MDQNVLAHLDDAQKTRLAALEAVFGSPGWKLIMAWAAENAAQHMNRQLHASSWEAAQFAKGARAAFGSIAELEEATLNEFASIGTQAALDAQLRAEQDNE